MIDPLEEGHTRAESEEIEREQLASGRDLLRAFDLGLQVRQFLDSEVGHRMSNDAEREILDLMQALVDVDEDGKAGRAEARRIRLRIATLNQWRAFFESYIKEGDAAGVMLQEREDGSGEG